MAGMSSYSSCAAQEGREYFIRGIIYEMKPGYSETWQLLGAADE